MFIFILILAGLLGLAVGSFINVLTLRWKPAEENRLLKIIQGRSHCLHCGQTLKWFEVIPLLSFVFLRGRCRHCRIKLSWQYPLVEGLTGVVFIGLMWRILRFNFFAYQLFSDPRTNFWVVATILIWFFYAAVLIALSVIDLRHYLLPDKIIFPAMGIALLANLGFYGLSISSGFFPKAGLNFLGPYADLINGHFNILTSAILGVLVLSAFLFLIYILSRGRAMGLGDVKLAALIGLMLGLASGIAALIIAFIIGAVVSLAIVLVRKKKLKDAVPFGPFLTLGVLSVIFLGETLLNFYCSLFNT
jgi:leader peptidase (prepilin peptidase)/N-methyltransferase